MTDDKVAKFKASLKEMPRDQWVPIALLGVLTAGLVYSYWYMFVIMAEAWESPQYSHAWAVPLFTAILIWLRREPFGPVTPRERWIGLGALCSFLAIRCFGAYVRMAAIDMFTFVPVLLAAMLMIGGWRFLRWAGTGAAFLIFMFPLPYKVERVVVDPLQFIATRGGAYALQTTGISTYATGNHVYIRDIEDQEQDLNVADACSGLRMLTIFVALSVAIVMVTDGALWEKIVIVGSAVPIAIFVNVGRITVYGLLRYFNGEWAEAFHEGIAAPVFMMFLAMGLLYLEIMVLQNLVIDESKTAAPVPVFGARTMAPRTTTSVR